ncbi:MAG: T9SS type A sorting domain-containing protein [Saprospiraceae bacterium]
MQLESIKKDKNDKLQFKLNTWDWYSFEFCSDYGVPSDNGRNQIYVSDFGLVYSYTGGVFSDDESQLIGHKRGNIIEGDIDPLCLITSNNNTLTNKEPFIQIYPNPTSEYLNILFSKNQNTPFSISIFDTVGKLVLEKKNVSSNSIDVSKLKKGFYFLKISSSFGDSIHKIVKQ